MTSTVATKKDATPSKPKKVENKITIAESDIDFADLTMA